MTLDGVISPQWATNMSQSRKSFTEASPYPLLVLDNFLEPAFAEQMLEDFPSIEDMPRSRDYMFGDKHELSGLNEGGSAARRYFEVVTSEPFQLFLRDLTGIDLFIDPAFFGGGFHQGGDGSFLDMHVDFNIHPEHPEWLRTLNVLIYLNKDWDPAWGGQLLLKSSPTAAPCAIEPLFNRAIIMQTGDNTYHGYRRMTLPDGVTRKSVAIYAYQLTDIGAVRRRTTTWQPEEATLTKRLIARHYNRAVLTKNRLLGSRTAKNR